MLIPICSNLLWCFFCDVIRVAAMIVIMKPWVKVTVNSLHRPDLSLMSGLRRNSPWAMSQRKKHKCISLLLSSRFYRIFMLSHGSLLESKAGCTLHFLVQYLLQVLLPVWLNHPAHTLQSCHSKLQKSPWRFSYGSFRQLLLTVRKNCCRDTFGFLFRSLKKCKATFLTLNKTYNWNQNLKMLFEMMQPGLK